eukprot:CAMPEP_0183535004 /NCGR_PEP_ID=MMETSP0371-20130417/27256_1 /TAXON_ID=268820 /ORGANISM="Peridinium aciculiferum, Strain PAER-2" /LENGTH=71 /DNA_ID=CAMNT_0025735417 /DNA_START=48 /DNA_END=260 /DNA_ORIENTATION=-
MRQFLGMDPPMLRVVFSARPSLPFSTGNKCDAVLVRLPVLGRGCRSGLLEPWLRFLKLVSPPIRALGEVFW